MRPRGRWAWVLTLAVLPSACADADFPVDGARAHRRVVFQVDAGPRIPGTPGHRAVRQWIAAELARLGGQVRLQTFVDSTLGAPESLTNLIGRWEPKRGADRPPLVLCAHYDTRHIADQDPDSARRGMPVPGANDGGSGVAVLLEVAELLAKRPPPRTIELVFFDGEDQGRTSQAETYSRGARGYAARLETKPRAAVLFDMVGDRDLAIHPEINSVERAASLASLVVTAARAVRAQHFFDEPRYHMTDDHIPLLDAGIPAVDVIDFDYPAWHTTQDLPDQVAPESLAEVARVAAWLVYQSPLAKAP
ncbi:MAG TPA: M28 family peptidase [Candidatus Eisenbacteria bacterium]|nr:M28 family peptidase [Candidatus Eisenbacteria bacterium]